MEVKMKKVTLLNLLKGPFTFSTPRQGMRRKTKVIFDSKIKIIPKSPLKASTALTVPRNHL